MLAVVNQPRIRIEAPVIPNPLLSFLRKSYGKVTIIVNDTEDEKAVPFQDTQLYKETRAKMTPSGNLKLLRKNRKLTQRALAEKSGIAATAISDMEHSRIPIGRKSAQKLATALGTSISNLFW
jgi:DNA-binding XRE family transcriptional regulator